MSALELELAARAAPRLTRSTSAPDVGADDPWGPVDRWLEMEQRRREAMQARSRRRRDRISKAVREARERSQEKRGQLELGAVADFDPRQLELGRGFYGER